MVPADSDRISRVPPYLGFPLARSLVSSTGLSPSMARLSRRVRLRGPGTVRGPATPADFRPTVWPLPRSLATTDGITIVFSSSGYLDVSVHRVCPLITYGFSEGYHPITDGGLPHSEIPGSKRAYRSPRLIAVRCVLLRLLAPRHPPCALSNLTTLVSTKKCLQFKSLAITCSIQFSRNKCGSNLKVACLATSYSPGSLRSKYHRRWRA